ncbi:MAG TPA: secretin N-terminal domain-containing protein [Candidatus Omnitrophota bacterium]|nr:secretin N-terminal domain-containing protein [Candidatus Omnitrophota bacterium]
MRKIFRAQKTARVLWAVILFSLAASLYAQVEKSPGEASGGSVEVGLPPSSVVSGATLVDEAKIHKQPSGLDKTIFLDLRDINVVDVLKFLALEGNLNIVTSKNVQGRSTLVLKNVTIRDALDIIVISNQLAYEIRNEIIYVMTEEEYRQVYGESYNNKRKILTRNLRYAKPSYVMTTLQSVQSSVGKVIIDEETGSVIMIDTPEKLKEMDKLIDDMEQKLETKVVRLQYADAKDVEVQMKAKLDAKSVGSVYGDSRSNQLIVTAYPDRLEEILPLIKSLDVKQKGILLEVRILQVLVNPKYDYGIDWEKAFWKNKHKSLQNLDFRGAFPISSSVSTATNLGTVGKIAIGKITQDDFEAAINMLKQVDKTNVLANPRLMVMDRQEAKINIGDKIPYIQTTTTGTGNNVSISEEIKWVDVGLQLMVTPVINDDGFVTMKIRPEISARTGTLVSPNKNEIPIVNTTFVESNVIVKDGVTVILGGLRRHDLNEKRMGLPFLMDIPLLGELFKSRSESTKITEIVILITPKLITGGDTITNETLKIKPSKLPVS